MYVLLQHPAIGADAPRFVRLSLQQDLLGGWELLRESGQHGARSQMRRELHLHAEDARLAFAKARDAELHRGFSLISSGD